MMTCEVVLGASLWVVVMVGLLPSPVGPAYPSNGNNGFLPAMDGDTPDCVQDPRDTFCLKPKKYPKDRIVYLLENKMYDLDSLLMDESRDTYTFEARNVPPMMYDYEPPPRTSYGPPPPSQTYGPPPQRPANGYLPPPRQHHNNNNNFSSTSKPSFHHPPSTKYGPPPPPPPSTTSNLYSQPPTPSNLYEPPAPIYDNEGPYPRIMRASRHRQRRQVGNTDLCPYEPDYIMPRAALNNRGTWMYVVNMEEVSSEFTQLVESKKCITDRCSGACNVPLGSSAVCQQQYVQKKLMALESSGNALAMDVFWFPSCCVCKIRPDDG